MLRSLLLLVGLMFTGTVASGANYEFDCKLWNGDSKGSRKDGTQKLAAAPTLVVASGEKASLLVGGQHLIGGKLVNVGREVHLVPTDARGGCVKVIVVLELHAVVGEGASQQVETKRVQVTSIGRLGETVRVEIAGKDPKKSDWVEVTVREAK